MANYILTLTNGNGRLIARQLIDYGCLGPADVYRVDGSDLAENTFLDDLRTSQEKDTVEKIQEDHALLQQRAINLIAQADDKERRALDYQLRYVLYGFDL